jgi:hypothetical protein
MLTPLIPTNLVAMPLLALTIETGTNEDWLDSIKYVVDDGSNNPDGMPQLDLTGIAFEMEVRRAVADHEVVLTASTDDGRLAIGTAPDYGFLLIQVDHEDMLDQQPGQYVADIVGIDSNNTRRIATIDLTIVQGVTRP